MTYSLAITGAPADSTAQVKTLIIADGACRAGEQAGAMSDGTPFLCKRPDGSQGYYVFDAERSTPTLPVLRPL